MVDLFIKIRELKISNTTYPLLQKNVEVGQKEIGVVASLQSYRFKTLWMALNQENYPEYMAMNGEDRKAFLNRILTGNILSFFKGIGLYLKPEERILLTARTQEKTTKFKDRSMLAFHGEFTTNVLLPDFIGLGKSVSRGFGTIQKIA